MIRLALDRYKGRMSLVARRAGHRPLHALPQAQRAGHFGHIPSF